MTKELPTNAQEIPNPISERPNINLEQVRDHTTIAGLDEALALAIDDLKRSRDEIRSFMMLREILATNPDVIMTFVRGSIRLAREKLNQDRAYGSFATLLGPIDAAIRVVGHQQRLFSDQEAFSIQNWTINQMAYVISTFPDSLIELAGNNTTAKNVPHRATYLLWLIDQSPVIQSGDSFAFIELGSSGGLILDALRNPSRFRSWMQTHGHRSDFAVKFPSEQANSTLGIDLIIPDLDWLKALILRDDVRDQLIDFMDKFERSEVLVGNATNLEEIKRINTYLDENRDKTPFIFSCSMFYQLSPEEREAAITQSRNLLRNRGGGYFLLHDKAVNRGIPNLDRSVSWIENAKGEILSPRIVVLNQDGTEWKILD